MRAIDQLLSLLIFIAMFAWLSLALAGVLLGMPPEAKQYATMMGAIYSVGWVIIWKIDQWRKI